MNSTLSSLYFGNLKPCTSTQWHNEEYEFHKKKFMELETKLTALLGEEGMKVFEEYSEHSDRIISLHCEMNFKEGFTLGGQMFAEVLTKQKDEKWEGIP